MNNSNKSREQKEYLINLAINEYLNTPRTSINTSVSIVGTHEFLTKIKNIFGGKHGTISNKSSKNYNNNAFQLVYGGTIARKFARYLYENATIYLDRKYKKFLDFCRIEEGSSRRKSSKIGEGCDANTEVSSVIAKGTETPQSVVGE